MVLCCFFLLPLTLQARDVGKKKAAKTLKISKKKKSREQTRKHSKRVKVKKKLIEVDDGDTVVIAWPSGDKERIRILGIDTPETAHPEHNLPIAQSYGEEATTFAQGAFSAATRIELLRSAELDPFGRTLGYIFLNGENYSLMVLGAKLAVENVSRFGDNGFPKEAAKIERLAKKVGPMPFENPSDFRKRMRKYSKWLNKQGRRNTH
tara:strand:+ start:231 stop:851 length:621 start_codon:yes stop_codon:yes gene_type:complete